MPKVSYVPVNNKSFKLEYKKKKGNLRIFIIVKSTYLCPCGKLLFALLIAIFPIEKELT